MGTDVATLGKSLVTNFTIIRLLASVTPLMGLMKCQPKVPIWYICMIIIITFRFPNWEKR